MDAKVTQHRITQKKVKGHCGGKVNIPVFFAKGDKAPLFIWTGMCNGEKWHRRDGEAAEAIFF